MSRRRDRAAFSVLRGVGTLIQFVLFVFNDICVNVGETGRRVLEMTGRYYYVLVYVCSRFIFSIEAILNCVQAIDPVCLDYLQVAK